jgi:rhamnose transport system ATP-binding protein
MNEEHSSAGVPQRKTALEVTGVAKSFGGVRALDGVSFELREGEIHALVGENGAGKSTLIKIITGALEPDAGEIRLRGTSIKANSPARARALGIAAIYQQPSLFRHLTVAENIDLATHSSSFWQKVNWKERKYRAEKALERVGARILPDAMAGSLSMPEQQLVEIAKAIDTDPAVLILDEPTASLGEQDVEHLFRILAEMSAQGVAIVYISHRFEELFRIADRITVLRDGRSIATRATAQTTNDELIRLMVGRDLKTVFPKREPKLGDVVFEVRNLSSRVLGVKNVGFEVRSGEILGLAGLVGSGRTETAQMLFGLSAKDAGEVYIQGNRVQIQSPLDAVQHHLAYLPEDRRNHGVILGMSVTANTSLASLDKVSKAGFLDFQSEQKAAKNFASSLALKPPNVGAHVSSLSGGNQQKVALSRWLMTDPKVLILDEPTQGIDVGAKSELFRLIGKLAEQGTAILMISSDMLEVLGMSDRIAVMAKGQIAGILNRSEATAYRVLELSLGHDAAGQAGLA